MPAGQRRMRIAAAAIGQRRLQRRRSRLLVQGFGAASETAENPAEAEAIDDAGAAARGVPSGAGGARREAVGWAKARSAVPTIIVSDSGMEMVGTPPGACAPGDFAHPTSFSSRARSCRVEL